MEELNIEIKMDGQKPEINNRYMDPASYDFEALIAWGLQDNQGERIPCVAPVSKHILVLALSKAKALVTGGVLLMSEETYGDLLCFDFEYFKPLGAEAYERFPSPVMGTIFNSVVYVSDEIPTDRLIALGREKAVVSIMR